MEGLQPEMLRVLQFLAAGLLATWLYHRLLGLPRPDPFHAVVQGLLFTIAIRFVVACVRWVALGFGSLLGALGPWNSDSDAVCSFLSAIAIAICCVFISTNDDLLFARLRRLGFTGLRSFPTEWYGTFTDAGAKFCYITIEFKNGRRLHGYPIEWPSSPVGGHLTMKNAAWISGGSFVALDEHTSVMLPTDSIALIEFHSDQQGSTSDGTDHQGTQS